MSPLTHKGEEIKQALKNEYRSEKKAEQVLYAGKNAGTFSGIDEIARMTQISEGPGMDAVLNWGGGVNAETVLPGGKTDPPNMPRSASVATGVGSSTEVDMVSDGPGFRAASTGIGKGTGAAASGIGTGVGAAVKGAGETIGAIGHAAKRLSEVGE
jgi:hypothetical protein